MLVSLFVDSFFALEIFMKATQFRFIAKTLVFVL